MPLLIIVGGGDNTGCRSVSRRTLTLRTLHLAALWRVRDCSTCVLAYPELRSVRTLIFLIALGRHYPLLVIPDNGIGVCAALALLDAGPDVKLPPLECLFTVDEETGLTGAFGLDASLLTGALCDQPARSAAFLTRLSRHRPARSSLLKTCRSSMRTSSKLCSHF